MNRFSRRIRPIELSLTPDQVVLLWIKEAIKGNLLDAALQTQRPGEAIGNLVVRGVREALKGQPETVIEGAVQQACQDANLLYNLAVYKSNTSSAVASFSF